MFYRVTKQFGFLFISGVIFSDLLIHVCICYVSFSFLRNMPSDWLERIYLGRKSQLNTCVIYLMLQ